MASDDSLTDDRTPMYCPKWEQHEFAEGYYGFTCRRCGLFIDLDEWCDIDDGKPDVGDEW
jgi:endogenous inhibitor of DNA gyrase (YacG/DUF329 family)